MLSTFHCVASLKWRIIKGSRNLFDSMDNDKHFILTMVTNKREYYAWTNTNILHLIVYFDWTVNSMLCSWISLNIHRSPVNLFRYTKITNDKTLNNVNRNRKEEKNKKKQTNIIKENSLYVSHWVLIINETKRLLFFLIFHSTVTRSEQK